MQESTSKEKVLKRIRKALIEKTENRFDGIDLESDVFASTGEAADVVFAEELTRAGGTFVFCESAAELGDGLKTLAAQHRWDPLLCAEEALQDILNDLGVAFSPDRVRMTDAPAAVTSCECLVARTGTVIVSSARSPGRQIPVFAPAHVVIASSSQLVYDLSDALKLLKKKYGADLPSMITAVTGPSRTADIEKTLIIGAHGPRELYVFVIESSAKA